MKKMLAMILVLLLLLLPFRTLSLAQEDCCADLGACEQLIDGADNAISDCEDKLIEAEAKLRDVRANNRDGDISLADLLEFIPGFRKLPAKQRALIVSIGLAAVALGISYIPPPTE